MPDPRKVWDPRHFRLDERVLKDVEARPPTFQHISANQYMGLAVPKGEPGGACSCHKKKKSKSQQLLASSSSSSMTKKKSSGGVGGGGKKQKFDGGKAEGGELEKEKAEEEWGERVMAGCVCGEECENRLLRIECSGGCGVDSEETTTTAAGAAGAAASAAAAAATSTSSSTSASTKKVDLRKDKWSNCQAGLACGNRQIGLKSGTVKVLPFMEEGMGWGLKLEESVWAGQLIREYVGEVLTDVMLEERMLEHQKFNPNGERVSE
jgi:hypothetical protein